MKNDAKIAEAAKAFVLDYLSDNDNDVGARDTWCFLLEQLEEGMGADVFELAEGERLNKLAENGP